MLKSKLSQDLVISGEADMPARRILPDTLNQQQVNFRHARSKASCIHTDVLRRSRRALLADYFCGSTPGCGGRERVRCNTKQGAARQSDDALFQRCSPGRQRTVTTDFTDIKAGFCGPTAGFSAKSGWDLCTGIGSVKGKIGK